jgi:hypothetical protein
MSLREEYRDKPGFLLKMLPAICAVFAGICVIAVAGVIAYRYGGWAAALASVGGCFALVGLTARLVILVRTRPPLARPLAAAPPPPPPAPLPEPADEQALEYDRIRPWVKIGLDVLPIVLAGVAMIGPRRSARFAARGYAMWRAIRESNAAQEQEQEQNL